MNEVIHQSIKKMLNDKNISLKSLPEYGNAGMKKREMTLHSENKKLCIDLVE